MKKRDAMLAALKENFGGVKILNSFLSEKSIKMSQMSDFNKDILITWNSFN